MREYDSRTQAGREPARGPAEEGAPSLAEFEALVEDAFSRLPSHFQDLCEGVALRVEDFADSDTLEAMGIESPFDLLGLYRGVSLDRKSVLDVPEGPDMVFLYRRPILEEWARGGDSLAALVTHILVHEIGHHFGLSDADMERIENAAE